jgi:hypothetical protein
MAKYQIVQGFIVADKEYPATIDANEVPDVSLLVASGRVVLIESSTSKADKAGDK